MNPPCTLRPATPDDAAAIARLLAGIGWFTSYQTGSTADHAAQLAPLLQPHARQWQQVACHATEGVMGFCAMHFYPLAIHQAWEAYVSELFIAESARGMGVGSQLLQQAVDAARARGCCRIWLVNNRERDSYQRGFYAQQGWTEQAHTARFVLNL
jgi:GNAT superfamily N-acetyltransferase